MIGVFDSGSGGLTVLKALSEALPHHSFLYFGDHGNAPYGHRSNEQIVELTRRGVDALMKRGCRLVILACNTAAAIALRQLQQNWLPDAYPDNRILGVLVPMVEAITGQPWCTDRIGDPKPSSTAQSIVLFATQKTVESKAFSEEVCKRTPHIELIQKACPGLVDAIEGGAGVAPLQGMINGFVSELDLTDTEAAVLGCTHFPLVESLFRAALPDHIKIYSQPALVADATADYLKRRPEFSKQNVDGQKGSITFLTSGSKTAVENVSRQFFDQKTEFETVKNHFWSV